MTFCQCPIVSLTFLGNERNIDRCIFDQMKYEVVRMSDLDTITDQLITLSERFRIFLFRGDLGAGKTTLIKKWMQMFGVEDDVSSPTFSIINHYLKDDLDIYHIDFYRLEKIDQALNIGIQEYLDSAEALIIIEWPELIIPLIDEDIVVITIELKDQKRLVNILINPSSSDLTRSTNSSH